MGNVKICHISDTHGAKNHTRITVPECDILIHSGDIGGRTSLAELNEFLLWFEAQPADYKIFIAGNHDICLDKEWPDKVQDPIGKQIAAQCYSDAKALIQRYQVKYLENTDYICKGLKFWGSPITPSFHRQYWAFNADRGDEIKRTWAKIPSDVDVLITHGPPYGILDIIPESFKATPDEDVHRGCKDLTEVTKKRLLKLKLHCFGHLHTPWGVVKEPVSNTRSVLFSNGSILNEDYTIKAPHPLIITL